MQPERSITDRDVVAGCNGHQTRPRFSLNARRRIARGHVRVRLVRKTEHLPPPVIVEDAVSAWTERQSNAEGVQRADLRAHAFIGARSVAFEWRSRDRMLRATSNKPISCAEDGIPLWVDEISDCALECATVPRCFMATQNKSRSSATPVRSATQEPASKVALPRTAARIAADSV